MYILLQLHRLHNKNPQMECIHTNQLFSYLNTVKFQIFEPSVISITIELY